VPGASDEEKMRLYDCGHAFHLECIRKYINEKNQKGSQFGSQHSKIKPVEVTPKMMEEQRCPWCYSDQFKINLEEIFQKNARRGGALANARNKVGVSQQKEDEVQEIMSDESFEFGDKAAVFRASNERRQVTGSVVQRGKRNIQEQRMAHFDRNFFGEGVTMNNFY